MTSLLKRRTLLLNGALGVLLVGGVGFAYISLADDGGTAEASTRSVSVMRGTVEQSVSASGSVESTKTQSLSFGTSGTVTHVYVKAGDRAKKGQVLARLDRTEAEAAVTAARASLDVADDDTSTAQGYASYVSAKNAYDSAVRTLDGTVLKAPFAGTVTAVNGTVGGSSGGSGGGSSSASTSTGSSGASGAAGGSSGGSSSASSTSSTSSTGSGGFIELADLSKVQVKGNFTESDVTRLKVGQAASVSFDALPGVSASGKVSAIDVSPTTSNNVVQYGVTVALTSKPSGVRLGQTSSVQVTVARAENVLYVPAAAVRTAGGQSTVTVLQGAQQVVRTVQVGVKGDIGTEIRSGLNQGDKVVLTAVSTGTNGLPGGGFRGGGFGGGGLGGGVRRGGAGGGLGGGGGR